MVCNGLFIIIIIIIIIYMLVKHISPLFVVWRIITLSTELSSIWWIWLSLYCKKKWWWWLLSVEKTLLILFEIYFFIHFYFLKEFIYLKSSWKTHTHKHRMIVMIMATFSRDIVILFPSLSFAVTWYTYI